MTERCETCNGIGEVPSGHTDMWGRMCWRWCANCDGTGTVEVTKPQSPDPAEEVMQVPVTAGDGDTITVGGFAVTAPGFSVDTFDRALGRAFMDGLRIAASDRADMVLVTNPRTGSSYTVSRRSCSCMAGQNGTKCKHVAFAIFVADVLGELPAQPAEVA